MVMIKAVIFDFYGVIISDDLWQFSGVDKQQDGDIFHRLANEVNRGDLSWTSFRKELAAASHKSLQEVDALYSQFRVDRELIAFAKSLSLQYKIGLLTNANRGHIDDVMRNLGLEALFDSIVVSADIGVVKPQPAIYKAILKDLEVDPEEAVFIDDTARNVDGAISLGIHAILYQDLAGLQRQLQKVLPDGEED